MTQRPEVYPTWTVLTRDGVEGPVRKKNGRSHRGRGHSGKVCGVNTGTNRDPVLSSHTSHYLDKCVDCLCLGDLRSSPEPKSFENRRSLTWGSDSPTLVSPQEIVCTPHLHLPTPIVQTCRWPVSVLRPFLRGGGPTES